MVVAPHAKTCILGYMDWFRHFSHPYITQMVDDEHAVVIPLNACANVGGHTDEYDSQTVHVVAVRTCHLLFTCLIYFYFVGYMS